MTLERYVLRQLLTAIIFSIGGMAFIALPGIAVNAVARLGGSSISTLLGYLPLAAVELLPYLAPVGFLLAIVSTYGRLAADNEWTAIQMAGIHPLRTFAPALLLAALFGSGTHWVLANRAPNLKFEKRTYLKDSLVRAFRNLAPGKTELPLGRFYLSARDRVGGAFRDVLIHVPGADGGSDATLLADEAVFSFHGDELWIAMENARTVQGGVDFKSQRPTVRLDLDRLFEAREVDRSAPKYRTSRELYRDLARGRLDPAEENVARYEIHNRLALSCTFAMFLLLGAPTGLLLRKGTQLGALAAAVAYALAYYLLSMRLGKTLAVAGVLPSELAAWMTTLFGSLVGVFLCARALRR